MLDNKTATSNLSLATHNFSESKGTSLYYPLDMSFQIFFVINDEGKTENPDI